jgi:hypothetical protein
MHCFYNYSFKTKNINTKIAFIRLSGMKIIKRTHQTCHPSRAQISASCRNSWSANTEEETHTVWRLWETKISEVRSENSRIEKKVQWISFHLKFTWKIPGVRLQLCPCFSDSFGSCQSLPSSLSFTFQPIRPCIHLCQLGTQGQQLVDLKHVMQPSHPH